MWKLTIEDDEGKQTQLPLAHEEYGVGRAESNSIRLTDRNVSRNHASLRKNGQGWFIKDLSSYNGTYINGARVVGESPIHSGDIVQLGDYRLELVDEGLLAAQAPGAAPQPSVPAIHQRPNRLVVVVGPQPGTEYPLDKEHFTVGRSEDATISINHSSVSRVHAELFALGNGRFEIVDKASANGIRINGVELKRGILEAGDALELGDVRLRFVGQGKIFRADMTQNLPAVAGFDMSRSVSGGGARSGMSKVIGVVIAVVVVAIVGLAAFLVKNGSGSAANTTVGKRVVTVANAKQVDEALKLLDAKDVEGAHKTLMSIAEDARPVDDANFKKVEAAWADKKLQEVNDLPATDYKGKKDILKLIAGTDTVDAKRRKDAADMIREIEAKEPPPVDTSPRPLGTWTGGTAAKTADPTPVPFTPVGPAPELNQEAMQRKALEPKVWGGRGSVEDIKMLIAICRHMSDSGCVARARGELKKKQE